MTASHVRTGEKIWDFNQAQTDQMDEYASIGDWDIFDSILILKTDDRKSSNCIRAIDLKTGQQIWEQTKTSPFCNMTIIY